MAMRANSKGWLWGGGAALAAAILLLAARAPSVAVHAPFDGEPEVVAATFSSAWCAACEILQPRLARVIPAFSGEGVKFVEYDLSFGPRDELRRAALADGLGADLYDRFSKATGFTVLVDVDTGEAVDILTINHSREAMRAAISAALACAAALAGAAAPGD